MSEKLLNKFSVKYDPDTFAYLLIWKRFFHSVNFMQIQRLFSKLFFIKLRNRPFERNYR